MQSPTIGALAAALATARAKFTPLKKSRTAKIKSEKGSYEYHYADLADLFDSVVPALSANGIVLTQPLQFHDGHLLVETQLSHASGEWMSSLYPVPTFTRAQDQGSALTYAKRYAASAILAIASEDDDDGAAASAATPSVPQRQATAGPTKLVGASKDDTAAVFEACKLAGAKTKDDAHNMIGIILPGVERVQGIPVDQLPLVFQALAKMQPEKLTNAELHALAKGHLATDADAPGDAAE